MKRHTALIKRMRQSIGAENREHILKDIDSLSLEKYIDEIAGAAVEGVGRCKTEKDVWSAVEVCTLIPPGHLKLISRLSSQRSYLLFTADFLTHSLLYLYHPLLPS